MRINSTRSILVGLFLLLANVALAQFDDGGGGGGGGSTSGGGGNSSGSFYNYSQDVGLTIDVNIWGFVEAPGKYRVPSTTRLIQLISYAGGPRDRARLSDIRILHDLTVDSTIVDPVVIFNLDEYQQTGNPSLNPYLYDNDTIIVPGDALNVFREVLGIFRDIALVVGTLIGLIVAIKQ